MISLKSMFHMKLHRILFLILLFAIPFQTRILYNPGSAYIGSYFDYHLAFFLYLSDILLFACFTAWLLFDPPNVKALLENRVFKLILAFLGLCLISLFHVKQLGLGWYGTLKWLEMFCILLYMYLNYRSSEDFKLAGFILFVSGVVQALIGLIQFHVQHMLGLRFLGEYLAPIGTPGLATIDTAAGKIIRAYGTLPHPNVLGAFLVLSFIMGLYLVSHETKRTRIIGLGMGLILILLGMFVTFSRLAWLATAIAGLGYIAYYMYRPQRTTIIMLLTVGIVSCATIFGPYLQDLKARVSDSNNTSVSDRGFFNQLGLDLIERYPLLGVGVGNYVEAQKDLFQLEPWQHQPAHNIFIFVGAELGLLGLGVFLMLLYELFRKLKNIVWDNLTLSITLVAVLFLLMGQFDHYFVTIQQGRLMFAVVLGLLAALPNLYEHQNNR